MNQKLLGEKIKRERKRLKLTQSLLAGNQITRNMLSRIENGSASPSLDTLEYLASQLGVTISYLLSEEDDKFFFEKKKFINKIYRAYEAKNYTACTNWIAKLENTDNELSYIAATSYFELGRQKITSGALISAKKCFDLSLNYCKNTVINTEHVESIIPIYLAITENVQTPLLEFDAKKFETGIDRIFDYEFFKYFTLDLSYEYSVKKYQAHIDAKILMKEKNYLTAIQKLTEAADLVKNDDYDAFLIFGIYTDLEQCYKQIFDFENAYLYASKRLSLLEGFKS